ncbi:glycosyltransferase [Leptolyngbya sp. FACHB-8]|uniref:glycosyltransferase family protein n=1 Tax=unclassified Leptolyngbya TaxID=2650499 RepID=UPI001687B8F2|nr:glycosyltransferase [Leptolyngbya sp. FACHB-8]MBD1913918.1 glycosyltransferase [Leptolyngbya sp. FACHB-8]
MTTTPAPSQSYRFCVERSPTRIYQRLIDGFVEALAQLGHTVELLNPSNFTQSSYINYINDQGFDFVLITNSSSSLCRYMEAVEGYGFEAINTKIIFIHHDSLFSGLLELNEIKHLLTAFCNHRERTYHFCLEYSNYLDLRSLGISHAFTVSHVSEYSYLSPPHTYQYDVSFVGHVLPSLGDEMWDMPFAHRVRADVWQRIADLDTALEPSAVKFATTYADPKNPIDFFSLKHFYISLLHIYSQHSRGEIIRRIQDVEMDIIGGDPAYLHKVDLNRRIEKETVRYHPPLSDYAQARNLYCNSQINLNITSLQFDTAVINRVIDVGAVGGFVLTDWRSDLQKLTSVAEEISYRSIEELNGKLRYYLHPDHQSERLEIAAALHQDVTKKCTYSTVVDYILRTITTMSTGATESLRVDLGCGGWKAEGFIGVDISPGPGVDVVADLNRRFPFADNSVEVVKAYDVVEHLPDRLHTMNEIWRICQHDAIVDIRVPSTDGRGAFQDPTHVSFWNINSFKYYCVEYPPYWNLCQNYGFRGAFTLVSLEEEYSEEEVVHVRAILKAIKQPELGGDGSLISGASAIDEGSLSSVNLLLCPNWEADEDSLSQQLAQFLQIIVSHPKKRSITALITSEDVDIEAIDLLLATVMMSVLEEVEIDESEGEPNIILITSAQVPQLKAVASHITAHVLLEDSHLAPSGLESVPSISLKDLETSDYLSF